MYDKLVMVTRKTPLEALVQRLGTRSQAKFYLEQESRRGGSGYAAYESEDAAYQRSRECLRRALPTKLRTQWIEREFLPTFTFGPRDLIVTLGSDGLVVNVAKYAASQSILAFLPEGQQAESQLAPLPVAQAAALLPRALAGSLSTRKIAMACATLSDGRQLHAVNELFIGARTHVSARYQLRLGEQSEQQSSSGVLVSTGAGSTGWLRALCAGASAIGGSVRDCCFPAESESLVYAVREPWPSQTTGATLVYGTLARGQELVLVSQMPTGGVIFSDGVESDYLPFESGAVARIGLAERSVQLLAR
jgi:NAD kinase